MTRDSRKRQSAANGSAIDTPQAPGKAALEKEKPGIEPIPPRKRGRRLRTISHVKLALAHNVREMEAGRRDPMTGNSVTNGLRTLADVMIGDVAGEIEELREAIAAGRQVQEAKALSLGKHTQNGETGDASHDAYRTPGDA